MCSYYNIVYLIISDQTTGRTEFQTDETTKRGTDKSRSDPKNKIQCSDVLVVGGKDSTIHSYSFQEYVSTTINTAKIYNLLLNRQASIGLL